MGVNELDEYWKTLETLVSPLCEKDQRRVAYRFCLMVEEKLDDISKSALLVVERLTLGQGTLQQCRSLQEKLENSLPKEERTSIYSPLIWALEPHTNSYPAWYSAGIAGLNLVDLKVATLPELTKVINEVVNRL